MQRDWINKIWQGDSLELLRQMPSDFVDCIVTSPPYWGLRDYGESTSRVWGGNEKCQHMWVNAGVKKLRGTDTGERKEVYPKIHLSQGSFCHKCGAWFGQLGLEPTLSLYLDHMTAITKELKRVLKPSGVMFWNHGDCYGGSWQNYGAREGGQREKRTEVFPRTGNPSSFPVTAHLRPKCLAFQNHRLILRMIDEQGWIYRNQIIWHKPNSMPSSVKDRFSNSYEPVFMLVKSRKYYFDLDAVRVVSQTLVKNPTEKKYVGVDSGEKFGAGTKGLRERHGANQSYNPAGKNPGDVWEAPSIPEDWHNWFELLSKLVGAGKAIEIFQAYLDGMNAPKDLWRIPTHAFAAAHFATFSPKLVEPFLKAAVPKWICTKCGKARVRMTESNAELDAHRKTLGIGPKTIQGGGKGTTLHHVVEHYTLGWTRCDCEPQEYKAGICLDPFMGSGTVGVVAKQLGLNYIGLELNLSYVKMAEERIRRSVRQEELFE